MDVNTERIPRWARCGDSHSEWLIIEHEDGRLEDLGYVETQVLMPVIPIFDEGTIVTDQDFRHKFRWRTPGGERQGAVLLGDADRDGDYFRQPYSIDLANGSIQRWHVGEQAMAKARESGLLR